MGVIVVRKEYTNTYKTKMVEKYKKSKMKISEFCRINEIPNIEVNFKANSNKKYYN